MSPKSWVGDGFEAGLKIGEKKLIRNEVMLLRRMTLQCPNLELEKLQRILLRRVGHYLDWCNRYVELEQGLYS